MKKIILPFVLLSFLGTVSLAQTIFQQVKTIMQNQCAGSGCHSGSIPGFNVTDADADLLADLIGNSPANPSAASKGYKYIDPGHPTNSFLLRKIAHGLDELNIEPAEGTDMPNGRPKLPDADIELIRQWIMFGASLNDPVVPAGFSGINRQNIDDFYNNNGRPRIPRPAAPPAGEGFQIHLGPVFYSPREEAEYFIKHDLRLPDTIEVKRLELFMNDESHHFIIRKFAPGTKQNWKDGMQPLDIFTAFDQDKEQVMAWQDNGDVELPEFTAYSWPTETALDLNYHLFNFHNEVLAADVYINIYTQPKGTAQFEMKSVLVPNIQLFMQPSPTTVHSFSNNWNKNNISIWSLSSHTHARGVDYDLFLSNLDGSTGPKIYEGQEKNGINQGFYDWEHPPFKVLDPMLYVDPTLYRGVRDTAKYINNTSGVMTWGFTTDREMMLFYVQYIDGEFNPITSVEEVAKAEANFSIYPNPFKSNAEIKFNIDKPSDVILDVYDMTGRRVKRFANTRFQQGTYTYKLDGYSEFNNALYLVKLTIDGDSFYRRIVKQ